MNNKIIYVIIDVEISRNKPYISFATFNEQMRDVVFDKWVEKLEEEDEIVFMRKDDIEMDRKYGNEQEI